MNLCKKLMMGCAFLVASSSLSWADEEIAALVVDNGSGMCKAIRPEDFKPIIPNELKLTIQVSVNIYYPPLQWNNARHQCHYYSAYPYCFDGILPPLPTIISSPKNLLPVLQSQNFLLKK